MPLKTLELIDLPCDCCGARDERPILVKRGVLSDHPFKLVQCSRCSFLYFNPRPTEASIARLYDSDYYDGKGFDSVTNYSGAFENDGEPMNLYLAQRLLAFRPPPAHILDYGCGLGDFARKARGLGYDVQGFEISPAARSFCAKNGLEVFGAIEEIPDSAFDIVTAVEVVEHAYAPHCLFEQVFRVLKPGGTFLYTTQNPSLFLMKKRLGLAKDDGYLLPEGHLNFFNRAVMKRYLKRTGFTAFGKPWLASATALKYQVKNVLGLHLPSGVK